MRTLFVIIFCLFLLSSSRAQVELYTPVNIEDCFEKGSRSKTGAPGPEYWQNRADYKIHVRLDPRSAEVSGSEIIQYENNSPDTLPELVITLLADFYKKGNPNDFNIPLAALNDGIQINKVKINGEDTYLNTQRIVRSGTNMMINLEKELLPSSSLEIEIDWTFSYPQNLTVRCGDYGDSTFFVAYFYPKIAVYDDIDGWDRHNYTGFGEYYGEYSDYEVNISVPGDFKVWASGELQNPGEVFTPKYYKKWKEAQQSMDVYHLISAENYLDKDIIKNEDWVTWTFKAQNIPDFSFGTSDKFLWDLINVLVDEESGRKATFNAAYRYDSKDYYKMAALGKDVLVNYSKRLPGVAYPYPEMTVFNGNSGMEFPMMCNDVSCEEWHETAGLAYHEMAHSYFPFFVGTNERKYAWMDEGWANLLPLFYFEEHSPGIPYLESRMDRYYEIAGKEIEVPLMTLGDLLNTRGPYRQASYNKSFFAYYYLYELLGEDLFGEALRGYMNSWAGKHPMPYDFFYSINRFSGLNLNWYWKNWFFEKNHADLSIEGVKDGMLIVKNKGRLMLPVEITITYNDNTQKRINKDISIWKNADNMLAIPLDRIKEINSIELGARGILDVNLSNNVFDIRP